MPKINKNNQQITSSNQSELIHDNERPGKHLHRKAQQASIDKQLPESKQASGVPLAKRSSVSSETISHPDFDLSTDVSTSGASERQSKSTGEFYFGNDPLSKQQIIDQLAQEQSSIYCIRSLEDLEKHGLIQQVWLENGQLQKAEGRLFDNEPITLIFDLTAMSPGDIASFNDILQVGPKCNDKPLGDQVRRVFLVNDGMLKGRQAANPDLWRRLGQMSQPVIPQKAAQNDNIADSVTDETLLAQHTTESIPENKAVVTIDFATIGDWYPYLFGSISLNERGQLVFSEGALARLEDDTHLVFKNAPWGSYGFKEALATALRKGGFEANRQWISMPSQISFSRDQISETQLNVWKERTVKESEAFTHQSPFVCINSHTIDSLKARLRVEGTTVVRTDMLANLLNGCHQLVITSELDQQQWLWLLTQLEQLPEQQRPLLFINVANDLLLPEERRWQTEDDGYRQFVSAIPCSHLTYEISPTDTMEFLQQVNLTSQNDLMFSLNDTPLMQALANGTPLILSGLERNPKLAAMLETLLLPSPYLFIHGHKVDLPKAKVTFIRSAQSTGSALIDEVFKSPDHQRQPPENPIYSLLKSLPRSYQKTYPTVPPLSSAAFQHKFEQQAETECQLDGSNRIMPCHQRKALHVLLAKAYRGDPAVYSFIKAKIAQHYPDQPVDRRANRSALQQWLIRHPEPELKDIKADFWTLARHCPAGVHQSITTFDEPDDASIKALATYLVGAADLSRQSSLARRLKVNPNSARKQSFFDGMVRSTLRDALIANKASLKHGSVISETVTSVERSINNVLVSDQSDQQKSQKIKDILAPLFHNDRLPSHCEDLPTALLSNQRHTQSWQERRLVHLANRVQEYPMVFLQGEAGAGKTFMAQAIAARAGYPDCQVMQMGPNRTAEDLFGGIQLISQQAGNKADHHTEFREGPILQWALSKNPPLLVLDEANLAPDGLLAPLAGLTRKPPVIHYQGREYPLTENHRIILTGNPDHYEGRHLDTTLKSRIPTFFYHPLPDTVLARSIILPGLPREWSDARKQQACNRLLTLFNHFKELVPGDLTTPRDIKDVLTTVRQILKYYPGESPQPRADNISEAQVNALIRRAFMDSLGGAVTGDFQQRLTSLNLWYQGQFPEDSSVVTGADQTFDQFLQELQAENRDADFSPEPVRQLVYRYWQSLDKDQGGRTATLVEGPAGWGKDFILDRTIRLWQKRQTQQQQSVTPFIHINANPNQWSTLVDSVKQAMSQGQLIAISELNLIPSSYLEGLFNDVLTGHAAPGFRLFATINPGSFDGREALSPALKSRCTQVRLGALSQQALEGLIQRLPGMPEGLPQWLSGHFHQLANALDAQNSPVQLSLDDLFSTAKHLARQSHEQSPQQRPDQWQSAFQQHLSLPFRALTTPLPGLQDTTTALAQAHNKQQRRLDLERIANGVPGLPAPITVKFGNAARSEQREVTVLPNITDQEMITAVQTVLKSKAKSSNSGHDRPARTSREKTEKPDHVTPHSFGDIKTEKPDHGTSYSFGDIEKPVHFKVTRYFPKQPYDDRQYRMNFLETRLDDDGQLRNYLIDWHNNPVTTVAEEGIPWRTNLREDELPGKIELTLNDQWQPLPALTPSDQLRAIRLSLPTGEPVTDFELARSEKTGQLLVKSQGALTSPVTIDFIIAPDQGYFTRLKPGESMRLQENLCSERLGVLLDERIFYPETDSCEAYQELKAINEIDDIPKRLNALMDWLDTFSDDTNVMGDDKDLLLAMLREKQGVWRHKAMIFQMLCHYWGIPARQVTNACHGFVEISPDGGNTWRQYQLGGGGQTSLDTISPDGGNTGRQYQLGGGGQTSLDTISPDGGNTGRQYQLGGGGQTSLDTISPDGGNTGRQYQLGGGGQTSLDTISPDGGNTGRQYQLGGGGETGLDTTEPDWGDYHRSGNSVLNSPIERLEGGQDGQSVIGEGFCSQFRLTFEKLLEDIDRNEPITDKTLTNLKELMKKEIEIFHKISCYRNFSWQCSELLTLPCYRYIKDDTEWRSILEEALRLDPIKKSEITQAISMIYATINTGKFKNEISLYAQYIEWILDFCDVNDDFKDSFYGSLHCQAKTQNDFPCRDRILKMASTMSFPDFKIEPLADKIKTDAGDEFIHDLPNSKYLESKIATVNIDRKYTATPKENSQIVPENLAAGLPAFLSQSTIKESKPVVVDLCVMGPEMDQRLESYIANHADKKTKLWKLIEKNKEDKFKRYLEDPDEIESTDIVDGGRPEADVDVSIGDIKDAFFAWVAQHQHKANNEWLWLSDEYTTCYLQSSPTAEVSKHYNSFGSGKRVPFEQSSEAIRTRLKKPTAIVLKEKDLLIMLDEFLSMA